MSNRRLARAMELAKKIGGGTEEGIAETDLAVVSEAEAVESGTEEAVEEAAEEAGETTTVPAAPTEPAIPADVALQIFPSEVILPLAVPMPLFQQLQSRRGAATVLGVVADLLATYADAPLPELPTDRKPLVIDPRTRELIEQASGRALNTNADLANIFTSLASINVNGAALTLNERLLSIIAARNIYGLEEHELLSKICMRAIQMWADGLLEVDFFAPAF